MERRAENTLFKIDTMLFWKHGQSIVSTPVALHKPTTAWIKEAKNNLVLTQSTTQMCVSTKSKYSHEKNKNDVFFIIIL